MGHRFDTGLPRAQRTLIRDAVIARFAVLTKTRGMYLRSVLALPRPIQGEGDEDTLGIVADALAGNTPAVMVSLGRKTYEATGMGDPPDQFRGRLELYVYAVSSHARGHIARLAGDAVADARNDADPGVETILEHCEELLCGAELGLPTVYEIRPVDESEIYTGADYGIWQQHYELAVQRDIDLNRGVTRRITEIQSRHLVDGAGTANPVAETLTRLESR